MRGDVPTNVLLAGRAHRAATGLLVAAGVALAGCSASKPSQPPGDRAASVGFVTVTASAIDDRTTLPGRVVAAETSEVRPQVSGILRSRLFTEGSYVHAGQPLYGIDPQLYQASANQARASVAASSATAEAAAARAARLRPLADMEAVSQQDYTDAQATARQARAQVALNRAQLDTAQINLRYTTITAPISGRIGRSLVTQGALVSASQMEPLATIQRLDTVYVDIQQAGADLISLRRALTSGGIAPASATVQLQLEDGSMYGFTGQLQFAEAVVDPATGTVTLRARFPNPRGLLLPGMFVRAGFARATYANAFLVPQTAVQRDDHGVAFVWLVDAQRKAERRLITAARTIGSDWVVTAGLRNGDRVITQTNGMLHPGAVLAPVAANAPQRIAPPSTEGDARRGAGPSGAASAGRR